MKQEIKHIAIFASGTGSNAQKIVDYFKNSKNIKISLIVCNNPDAGVLKIGANEKIPALLIEKQMFRLTGYVTELKSQQIEFIVLAGFLWKIPPVLIEAFKDKIINIHPALLPAYGGKGMYGMNVHKTVVESEEKESGITIHYLNEHYDEGKIILQKKCKIASNDTPETLAQKVQELEHEWYPKTIHQLLKS